MTVKELIEELLDMPMNAKVVTTHCTIEHKEQDVECIVYDSANGLVILYDMDDTNQIGW